MIIKRKTKKKTKKLVYYSVNLMNIFIKNVMEK